MSKIKKALSMSYLVLAAVIWGVAFVAQVDAINYVGSFTYTGVRFGLGALSLIPIILIFERGAKGGEKLKSTFIAGILAGVILFAAVNLQQVGIEMTQSAGKAGFITGLYTVIVPVIGIFIGRRSGLSIWIGAVCACVGLYLLSVTNGFAAPETGDIVLFAGALLWAVHILVIDKFVGGIYPLRFSALQFSVCAAISMACAFAFETVSLRGILAGYAPILYGGVLSAGIAYTLQIVGQKDVEPAKAAIVFSMESLFAAIGGALILGERMTARGYIGCGFIFAGIIVSQLTFAKPEKPVQNAKDPEGA
ncbi:MAG: DMT family transporter [Oscillospiraceae bacterium]|jgi:drug/metabolite transporter (DMT)-like permease|nr:DMT family transporter [Oscillospiraceae bacterium]